jgi:hypothetical protein
MLAGWNETNNDDDEKRERLKRLHFGCATATARRIKIKIKTGRAGLRALTIQINLSLTRARPLHDSIGAPPRQQPHLVCQLDAGDANHQRAPPHR